MLPCARIVALLACLFVLSAAVAQEPPPQDLRLDGLSPGGARGSVSGAGGPFDLTLTHLSDRDRQARGPSFYEGHEDLQYGRAVWVPARSTLNSWLLGGPAPPQSAATSRTIRLLLYDR